MAQVMQSVDIPPEQHPNLSVHYESPEQDTVAIAEIAELLTRGQAETLEHLEQIRKIEDKDTLRTNAGYMHEVLQTESNSLRGLIDASLQTMPDEKSQQAQHLLEAIDDGDEAAMEKLGLSFEYAQLDSVVATILKGKPPVEIETVGPYAAAHVNPQTDKLEIDISKIPPDEMAGILVAGLLRKIDPVAHNTRIVSLLDELNNFTTGRQFTEDEQNEYVTAMAEFYGEAGVLKPDDIAGEDFILLRESELLPRVAELEHKLAGSGQGTIETNESGVTHFIPVEELVDGLALHSDNRVKELKNKGILLRRADGAPTCQAMDAAGFLSPLNKQFMHVIMLDKSMEAQQDKTYALLKALGIVQQERYHNIFFDSEHLSPEIVAYGISKTLERHTATFLSALDKYDAAINPSD